MNLINISGNTFYIRGGTNTGLYLFDDNSALIIDPGLSGARPNKIIKILNKVIVINKDKKFLNQDALEKCIKTILLKTILLLDISLIQKFNLSKNNKLNINQFIKVIIREFIKDIIKK